MRRSRRLPQPRPPAAAPTAEPGMLVCQRAARGGVQKCQPSAATRLGAEPSGTLLVPPPAVCATAPLVKCCPAGLSQRQPAGMPHQQPPPLLPQRQQWLHCCPLLLHWLLPAGSALQGPPLHLAAAQSGAAPSPAGSTAGSHRPSPSQRGSAAAWPGAIHCGAGAPPAAAQQLCSSALQRGVVCGLAPPPQLRCPGERCAAAGPPGALQDAREEGEKTFFR